ncbi:hypothetical protein ACH5RR_028723 [Cinchona calisaya]|uniref:C3H1-type domain-containing protein n=1 Tax=Cinchona calisaya TaxID=153742 RepID=A0ABD2YPL7_9GENT
MSLSFTSSDMGSVCADQQHHKFHHSHQLCYLNSNNKKSLVREIEIPPRKLLTRRANMHHEADMFYMNSSSSPSNKAEESALLQKFLPYNNMDDDDANPYSSDHFRMYEFKVRKCTRSRSHDWTDCPFAHPGEKARRRDPRRYHYSGTVCSEFRRGGCSRGDNCEFAHGVFECWLHPSRYRTEACKDGKNCKRKVCFFAHSPRQLRVLPPNCHEPVNSPVEKKQQQHRNVSHCCMFCHSVAASPTSTLMGMSHLSPPLSPSLSPPLSPVKAARFSPVSRYNYKENLGSIEPCGLQAQAQLNSSGGMSYKDALTELMSSIEAMRVSESSSHAAPNNFGNNLPWLDVNFSGEEQQQFILSPSTPSPVTSKFLNRNNNYPTRSFIEENKVVENGLAGPDLGWVNDLLT